MIPQGKQVHVIFAAMGLASSDVSIYKSRYDCNKHQVNFIAIVDTHTEKFLTDKSIINFISATGGVISQYVVSEKQRPTVGDKSKLSIQGLMCFLPNLALIKILKMKLFIQFSKPHNSRYIAYKNALQSIDGIVILIDSRDAKFQRCPGCLVENLTNNSVHAVLEGKQNAVTLKPHSLFLNKSNMLWITRLLGYKILSRSNWGDKQVLCSGVIIGSKSCLLKVIDSVIDSMLKSSYFLTEILDQAALNYVYYNCNLPIKTMLNGYPIFHMATTPENIFFGEGGGLRPNFSVVDGKVMVGNQIPFIIHQFDRFPQLKLS